MDVDRPDVGAPDLEERRERAREILSDRRVVKAAKDLARLRVDGGRELSPARGRRSKV